MSAREHYENHLSHFYSWMTGDFSIRQKEQEDFFRKNGLQTTKSETAIDLGAGIGLQSVSLAQLGYKVFAIDFNKKLLDQLQQNAKGLDIECIEDDITNIYSYKHYTPSVITCMGDTITHLEDASILVKFLDDCYTALNKGGKLIISFRDYSIEKKNEDRFVPVKSDESRILTCFLEYSPGYVKVTDLMYEKTDGQWKLTSGYYHKIRISEPEMSRLLERTGFSIKHSENNKGFLYFIAEK